MKLVISNTAIRQDAEGRFCLNDLHRAAVATGANERTKEPGKFFASSQTVDLVQELETTQDLGSSPVHKVEGRAGGTYVCKELVYAYAMWISPKFHLQVIRTFDAVATGNPEKAEQIARPGRTKTLTRNQVAASILLLRSAAEDLKLAPSAVLGGYQRLESQLGVAGLLPAYAVDAPTSAVAGSSEATKAVGDLLEEFDVSMSAIAFNRLLLQHGFLEERERPSSKGGVKRFKVVTDLEYGKNVTNPSNPRETQPHWYVSKFAELLDAVLAGEAKKAA